MEDFARLNLVGESPAFLRCLALVRKYAACHATVLVRGETGTGKELAARAIHYLGGRSEYPFIPVNCGAIPETLVENELFGHHQHSGLALFTPADVFCGRVGALLATRQAALNAAYVAHPERFVRGRPVAARPPKVVAINRH